MGAEEMKTIGGWMLDALKQHDDPKALDAIRESVAELANQFPVPSDSAVAS